MNRWSTLLIPCIGVLALVMYLAGNKPNAATPEEPQTAETSETSSPHTPEKLSLPLSSPKPSRPIKGEPLLAISISPESRVKASAGNAIPQLKKEVWIEFPIEIENAARMTAPLFIESEQAMESDDDTARDRWLKIELKPAGQLTGDLHEKRIVRLWSRDHGKRAAILHVNAGQGTQDLGFRSDVLITFDIAPSDKMANTGREEAENLLDQNR